jgi:hypothetical protein
MTFDDRDIARFWISLIVKGAEFRPAFPDLHYTIELQIAQRGPGGDSRNLAWDARRGVSRHDFWGVLSTGKQLSISCASFITIVSLLTR